jgi:hypothetical protein
MPPKKESKPKGPVVKTLKGFTFNIDKCERKTVEKFKIALESQPEAFSGCPINDEWGVSKPGMINFGIPLKNKDVEALYEGQPFLICEMKVGDDWLSSARSHHLDDQLNRMIAEKATYKVQITGGQYDFDKQLWLTSHIREWSLLGVFCYQVSDVLQMVIKMFELCRNPPVKLLEYTPKIIPLRISETSKTFVCMVMQIDGVSYDYAVAINKLYKCPGQLCAAANAKGLEAAIQDVENERAVKQQRKPRALTTLAQKIYDCFNNIDAEDLDGVISEIEGVSLHVTADIDCLPETKPPAKTETKPIIEDTTDEKK